MRETRVALGQLKRWRKRCVWTQASHRLRQHVLCVVHMLANAFHMPWVLEAPADVKASPMVDDFCGVFACDQKILK